MMKKYNANSYCISSFRYPKLIKEYVLRLLKIAFKRTRSTYAYRNDKLPPRRFCAKCDNYCYYITCDSIWIIWHPYGSALFLILNSTLLGWLVSKYFDAIQQNFVKFIFLYSQFMTHSSDRYMWLTKDVKVVLGLWSITTYYPTWGRKTRINYFYFAFKWFTSK